MARRSYYGRNRRSSSRRLIMFAALAIAATLAVWWLTTQPDNNSSDNVIGLTAISDTASTGATGAGQEPIGDKSSRAATERPAPTIVPPTPIQLPTTEPPAIINDPQAAEALSLLKEGRTALTRRDYITGRKKISRAIELGMAWQQEQMARELLNTAADQWLFTKNIFDNDTLCRRYKVVSGDLLVNIGKQFGVPYQLLMHINGIKKPQNLAAGQTIKIIEGPFNVIVERKRFLMSVYLGDILVRSYQVGLGAPGRQTPTGLWRVKLKQPNPKWTDPDTNRVYLPNDPDNPLGEYWIALEGISGEALGRSGFGIHGTVKPEEIGRATSRGCIRLHNGKVSELYDMLIEQKSQVRVVE